MATDIDNLKHDEKARELQQKWTYLLNEAVNYDTESDNKRLYSFDRTRESTKRNMEKDRAEIDYYEYLFRLNNNLVLLRRLADLKRILDI